MTRISKPTPVKCGICKTNNMLEFILSTSAFGSPDLDTRPSVPARYDIYNRVFKCKRCNYSNSDITKVIPGSEQLIKSDKYIEQINNEAFHKKVDEYLCMAILLKNNSEHKKAFFAFLRASWICNDTKYLEGANYCRLKAIDEINICQRKRIQVTEALWQHHLLTADLYRRTSQFEKAMSFIKLAREVIPNDRAKTIVIREEYFIHIKNTEVQDAFVEEKDKNINLENIENIESILAFKPYFENKKNKIAEWGNGKKTSEGVYIMPYPDYHEKVGLFFKFASSSFWRDFEYDPDEIDKNLNPEYIKRAFLFEIKSMLTYCVRGEKFCSGFWAGMIKDGIILAILNRLTVLLEEAKTKAVYNEQG